MAKRSGQNATSSKTLLHNSIDTLVANIRFAGAEEPVDTITITSSIPNEGKSTIAVNLATALAENDESVLLVECDVHRRSLAGMLSVRPRTGLYSVLLERVPLEEAVVDTGVEGMQLLDCEPSIPNPSNVFASVQFRNLVKRLRRAYDYVVLDTPPLSAYVDGAVVGAASDATLLVTRWDYVRRDDVRAALEQLQKADANVIGTVLNCCPVGRDYYYYGERKGRTGQDGSDAPRVVDAPERGRGAGAQNAQGSRAAAQQAGPQGQGRGPQAQPAQPQPAQQRPQAQAHSHAAARPAQSQAQSQVQPPVPATSLGGAAATPRASAAARPDPGSTAQFMLDAQRGSARRDS